LIASVEAVPMPMVWPSEAALAMAAVPIEPPAPARLSTMNGLPSEARIASAITRAITSVEPPAANGTISVTGFGVSCAIAGAVPSATSAIAAKRNFRHNPPPLIRRNPAACC
jgi:hypothetical protein